MNAPLITSVSQFQNKTVKQMVITHNARNLEFRIHAGIHGPAYHFLTESPIGLSHGFFTICQKGSFAE